MRNCCSSAVLLAIGLALFTAAARGETDASKETPVAVTGSGAAPGLGPAARSSSIRDAQTAIVIERLEHLAPSRDFTVFAPLVQAAPT
ncbi:MAG: hypothetical protein FJY92_06965, partial [Candidatus Hydrogenedentes bacterium]|nr:hypothetical protein [Candidatus Hydrogenedentota bacterium]